MRRPLTPQITTQSSLESFRKEAKRWLKALRAGDAQARTRFAEAYPDAAATAAAAPGLRDVQHALAREHGVAGWAALTEVLADHARARRTHAEHVAEFLDHACADDLVRRQIAARILARHPEVGRDSLHTAVVCGDHAEVERILAERPAAASEKGGPARWEPLLYLCFGRLPIAAASDNAVAIARALLDRGADPNTHVDVEVHGLIYRLSAMSGLMGEGEQQAPAHPQAEAIARVLLDRGADPYDRQGLYNTSLRRDDVTWLELLFAHATKRRGPREGRVEAEVGRGGGRAVSEDAERGDERSVAVSVDWNDVREDGRADSVVTLDYLLGNAVVRNRIARAEWLLARGARATAVQFYSRRNLHEEAVLRGFTAMAYLLQRFGAQPGVLEGIEAFQAACLRLDRVAARKLLDGHPEYLLSPRPMMTAAEVDRPDVAALLLDLGMSPDVEDREHGGQRALHTAAASDAPGVAALLIARGADVDARETAYDATPLGWAMFLQKPRMIELLSRVSRDTFNLAATGNIERLRDVFRADPTRATDVEASSGNTTLFFLPQDDDRAVEVVELLLACGVDPAIKNGDGLTAAECATKRGLDNAAELLQSKAT